MGRPGTVTQKTGVGDDSGDPKYAGYLLAEFTYPILSAYEGGAKWFYSRARSERLCSPAEELYQDYLGAVKYGNIFSIDVGPDFKGKLRAVDVETLRKVGEMIRKSELFPSTPDR